MQKHGEGISYLTGVACGRPFSSGKRPVGARRSCRDVKRRTLLLAMPDPLPFLLGVPAALIAALYLLRSVRVINQWEVALKFTLGKLSGRVSPGLRLVAPGIQKLVRVDSRIRNRDLPYQQVITQDNVTASIDAVIYYKVVDVEKAVLNVENFEAAVWDRARVVLRDVAGETRLDELLTHREQIAAKIRTAVEQFVAQWGLHIELIALKDIQLPTQMQEVIARKAIAERDRQYVIIKSQADVESAKNFADAARILASSPGGMELRRLEALQNLTAQGTSKVIFDLAKPYADVHGAAAVAAAMEGGEKRNVRVAKPEPARTPKLEDDDEEDPATANTRK
jgi:regulator of protease activity HflC (stomatin/prohibitin superfamily)